MSLVPAGTEFCFVLDAWDRVRAVSHECDFPPEAVKLPRATRPLVDSKLPSKALDAAVRERMQKGEGLYEVDAKLLAKIKPGLILTQTVCDACAITPQQLDEATARLRPAPEVFELDAHTFEDVLRNLRELGHALDEPEATKREMLKQWSLAKQIRHETKGLEKPRVAVLDWLDPPMFAGHWTKELVEMAGGTYDLVPTGEKSRWGSWKELKEYAPDVLIAAPCGRDLEAAWKELEAAIQKETLATLDCVRNGGTYAADGNRYFNRPGPRLVYSAALIARAAHLEQVGPLPPAIESGLMRYGPPAEATRQRR